ncbi:MAG: hypothetical protein JXQ75_04605 [Phycisphaerae bacterium]|nr:hypothetical protein [Phycisphaerae bacterium]
MASSPNPHDHRSSSTRIAQAIGDWVRAMLIVVVWAVALAAALAAGYLALRALLYVVDLAHCALNL